MPAAVLSPAEIQARSYDKLTIEIARHALSGGGNSIDIGAHDGGILKRLVRLSKAGQHWAFEPIPSLAAQLQKHFPDVRVQQHALADYDGWASFNYVPGAAAFSSLLPRTGTAVSDLAARQLRVQVKKLDTCIPADLPVAFIKIDVEGAEAAVLRGAANLLRRYQPVVVFECSSAKLEECVPPLEDAGLRISMLGDYVAGIVRPLSDVMKIGRERGEYYYVASAERAT